MSIGPTELLIIVVAVIGLALIIWGIVDVASRPEWAWQQARQSKVLWILLQAFGGLFFAGLGVILAIVYLAAIRRRVARAQEGSAP